MSVAITYSRFGSPEVLTITQVEPPVPGPGQVRVQVRAASVNPVDVKMRRGDLAALFPLQFPLIPGLDAAGVVNAVGDGVADVKVGDEVFGVAAAGVYAQYALFDRPIIKPAGVSWEVAASLPVVGETAFRALKHLDVHAGQTLLIHGASGSVGTIAVQLAVARGVTVIAAARADEHERLAALGATPVAYGDGWVERVTATAPHGVDAALDAAGAGVLPESIKLTGDAAMVVTIADMSAAQYGVLFTGLDPADHAPEALAVLAGLAASGNLTVPVWRTYPLAEAARAHADIEARRHRGKIVLVP
jgi:NADPH:quinone reductase-like Zn-dependent oxidoreductase